MQSNQIETEDSYYDLSDDYYSEESEQENIIKKIENQAIIIPAKEMSDLR